MKLNFKKLGEGKPLIILHGIFGSLDNWLTVGKALSEYFSVYLVDQRNHGQSPHDDQFDYDALSSDLLQFINDQQLEKPHLIGHSMGGKTCMKFACQYPELVEKLVVVDIAPKFYTAHHQDIFEAFHSLKLKTLESRKQAETELSAILPDPGVRQFILKNLTRDDRNQFAWKLNLAAIESNIDSIGEGLEPNESFDGPSLFIGGGRSKYIKDEDHPLIRKHFPKANIKVVPGAGHWVHAEKPDELLAIVLDFLT